MERLISWIARKKAKVESLRSWLSLFCVISMNSFIGSQDYLFSFLYDSLIDQFHSTRRDVGWAISVHWIFLTLSSIFVSPLVDRFGCRIVAFVSFAILGIGYSLSGLCPYLTAFHFLFGFVAGIGTGGAFLSASTMIQRTFDDNRGLATAVASIGFSLSAVTTPIYIKAFQDAYDTMAALLFHGAICLHGMPLSLSFKSNTSLHQSPKPPNDTSAGSMTNLAKDTGMLHAEGTVNNNNNSKNFVYTIQNGEKVSRVMCIDYGQTTLRTDMLSQATTSHHEPKQQQQYSKRGSVLQYFRGVFDLKLMKDLCFDVAILHFMLLMLGRNGILAQYISYAKYEGIPTEDAAYLLTLIGFGNLIARISSIFILNLPCLNPIITSTLSASIIGACGALACFSKTYLLLSIGAAVIGFAEALAISNLPLLVVHLVGVPAFSRGFSIFFTCILPAPLAAAPFTGWLIDASGSYFLCFTVMACTGTASVVLGIIVFVISKRKKKDAGCKETRKKRTALEIMEQTVSQSSHHSLHEKGINLQTLLTT